MHDLACYFDNAATTPLDPRVLAEMMPFLQGDFGNPHSIHSFGQRALSAVDHARERVALLIGAEDPSQVTFTSGATEANNWVLTAHEDVWVSPFEHSSIEELAAQRGLNRLSSSDTQVVPPSGVVNMISVMGVNNEMGTVWDVRDFRPSARLLHSDLTQQAGKLPLSIEGIDFASLSAHKFYGPKGIGALYSAFTPPDPYLVGGGQENGFRAGTLNVPAIVGMGAAAAIAVDEQDDNLAHAQRLRETLLEQLTPDEGWRVNGGDHVSPYVLSISFEGLQGETMVIEADRAGYAISAGAACSSGSNELSHVWKTQEISEVWARGSVRVSFGRENSVDSSAALGEILRQISRLLRTMT